MISQSFFMSASAARGTPQFATVENNDAIEEQAAGSSPTWAPKVLLFGRHTGDKKSLLANASQHTLTVLWKQQMWVERGESRWRKKGTSNKRLV